ncbi:MAG: hypothetical protein C5B48_01035 [Candidatus Rokuibacteriota bacterium]|nr:MAG: hypothetical protein C5B48_01035 [Candidatus Rokubacteria bacterium]
MRLLLVALGIGLVCAVANAEAAPIENVRSANVAAHTNQDPFMRDPALRGTISRYGIPYLRIPFRSNFSDADYLTLLQGIKEVGARPQVIVRGNCTADLAGSSHLLQLVDTVFPTGNYYVEYGNENDLQCGLSAANYIAGWNRDVPQLRASHPRALFMGPVNYRWDGPYVSTFLARANPRPDAVSWHEYACSTANSDAYCLAHIANWSAHLNDYDARAAMVGYRPPVWISEWNLDPFDDARYNEPFIKTWVAQALARWEAEASAGRIAVAELYPLAAGSSTGGFQLFRSDGTLTLEGQQFFAGLPVGGTPPPLPGPPGSTSSFAGVALASRAGTVSRNGRVRLSLACPVSALGHCSGTATLTTSRAVAAPGTKRRKKVLVLGWRRFSIPPGRTGRVIIKLSSRARKLVATKQNLKARQVVVAHDSRGTRKTTRGTITLKVPKQSNSR